MRPYPRRSVFLVFAILALGASACERSAEPSVERAKAPAQPVSVPKAQFREYARHASGAIVAIGDLHGDWQATRRAFRMAGATNEQDQWIGGTLTVVQTGDQLDRGDDERTIIDWFDQLSKQAAEQGGALIVLNGNHELMNVSGDFRYVTPDGMQDFADVAPQAAPNVPLQQLPSHAQGRAAAFWPGGPYAKRLAHRPVVVQVNDTLFVHGGVLPSHVRYGIDRINAQTRDWLLGRAAMPAVMSEREAPVWTRRYSDDDVTESDCRVLDEVLASTGAKRMVVGHTPQKDGITSACSGKVWRIDVGMSAHYRGSVQVLRIDAGKVQPITGS